MSDIEAEFADLARTHPGTAAYTAMDRYRDFRAVLLGSDQGKRVLYEIMSKGHMFASSAALGRHDANKTFFHEGERNLALMIFGFARAEPKAKPMTQGKSNPETDE
jgi:hypothetical protein